MPAPKRVLCIMDMAAVGRSSLAAVLPVLAACGVQGCPLPACLLSTHTGGFGEVEKLDAAAFAQAALAHFARENISFSAVYTGYLGSAAQFRMAQAVLETYPHAFVVVDPAMADGGRLYRGLPQDTPARMAALCEYANLITPNFSESALLTGQDPAAQAGINLETVRAQLAGAKRSVLLTSVPAENGGAQILGCGPGGKESFALPVNQQPQSYPGTGDLYTAALTGLLLGGHTLRAAARTAADFTAEAVRTTLEGGGEVRHGVWFEPLLPLLSRAAGLL